MQFIVSVVVHAAQHVTRHAAHSVTLVGLAANGVTLVGHAAHSITLVGHAPKDEDAAHSITMVAMQHMKSI